MTKTTTWGDAARYYAQEPPRAQQPDIFTYTWTDALSASGIDARTAVERSVQRWNTAIRDHLRNETGLRLSTAQETLSVPVRVMDGIPTPLRDVLVDFSEWAFLLLNRSFVDQAARGAMFLRDHFDRISPLLSDVPRATSPVLNSTYEFATQIQTALKSAELKKRWTNIKQDVLGAYFFRVPVIHLYWMPMGIAAAVVGASVEAVAAVVLAHELAHAYTHLGADIDGFRWPTNEFALTELAIVEGLAEFYCGAVAIRLEPRARGVNEAYLGLQALSDWPYTAHQCWTENGDRDPGELVRRALIEGRRTNIQKYDGFTALVAEGRQRLRRRPRTARTTDVGS